MVTSTSSSVEDGLDQLAARLRDVAGGRDRASRHLLQRRASLLIASAPSGCRVARAAARASAREATALGPDFVPGTRAPPRHRASPRFAASLPTSPPSAVARCAAVTAVLEQHREHRAPLGVASAGKEKPT